MTISLASTTVKVLIALSSVDVVQVKPVSIGKRLNAFVAVKLISGRLSLSLLGS